MITSTMMSATALMKPSALVQRFRSGSHSEAFRRVGSIAWLPGLGLGVPPIGYRPAPCTTLPDSLGRIGNLELRLAKSPGEVKQAQRLRYQVFFEELSAIPSSAAMIARRDMDEFDAICDHLLVLDHSVRGGKFTLAKPTVVGTYRLLRADVADINWGFYTSSEFGLGALMNRHPGLRFLELGRSCVSKPYRDKRTVELLWRGIYQYVIGHGIDVMVGCASLDGIDPNRLALPLSYLHHFHSAPEAWHVAALPDRAVAMDRLPREAVDPRVALRSLPPLIKGYLRLGAYIGEGAVVDHQFGTTDVCIVLPVSALNQRHVNHYGSVAPHQA